MTMMWVLLCLAQSLIVSAYDRQCDSPCEMPVKGSHDYQLCYGFTRFNDDRLCDPESVLSHKSLKYISKYLASVDDLTNEVYNMAIYYLRTLVLPPMDDTLMKLISRVDNVTKIEEVPELCEILYSLETEEFDSGDHWESPNVTIYIDAFANALRQVWFRDQVCSERNLLILVIAETVVTHTGTPVVTDPTFSVSVGSTMASILSEDQIESAKSVGDHCAADLVSSSVRLVESLQTAFQEWKDTQKPQHNIPDWAIKVFAGCFVFTAALILLDWLVIERLQLRAREGTMGTGKPPTRVFMSNISKMRKTSTIQ